MTLIEELQAVIRDVPDTHHITTGSAYVDGELVGLKRALEIVQRHLRSIAEMSLEKPMASPAQEKMAEDAEARQRRIANEIDYGEPDRLQEAERLCQKVKMDHGAHTPANIRALLLVIEELRSRG